MKAGNMSKLRSALDAAKRDLEDLRDSLADLKARRVDVENAPANREEIERRIDSEIDRARAGNPLRFARLSSAGRGPTFSAAEFDGALAGRPFELWSALAPERLREAMLEAAPHGGLDPEQRAAELARLDKEIQACEIAEELALRELEVGTGVQMPRRPDASVAILLAPDHELAG